MAKTDFNVLGRQSGKIGPVVGMVRKGIQMFRAYTNKYTEVKTEDALIRQVRFATLSGMATAFKPAVRLGFAKAVKGLQSPQNVFVKRNYAQVTATDPEAVEVEYGSIVVSQGNAAFVGFNTPSFAEEAEVSVAWSADTLPTGSAADKVYVFVYQPDTNTGVLSMPAARSTGSITIAVPALWSGMKVHVYGFAISAGVEDETGIIVAKGTPSPSTYVGTGNIA